MVLLEAMAAGLPIISMPLGGIPETVRDDETAVIAPPRDVAGLAKVLARAGGDPELRLRLGESARRSYLERYVPAKFESELCTLVRHPPG